MGSKRISFSFLDQFAIQSKSPEAAETILRNRESHQLVLMKEISIDPRDYQQTLATLEYQKNLNHEQLVSIIDFYPQEKNSVFMVLYEYCSISLEQEYEERLSEERGFDQSELWSIFSSLILGLSYLQENNVGHGSISLKDSYLNEAGFIKICDPTSATNSPDNIEPGYFYSPQMLKSLKKGVEEEVNIFKSDAYCLGCCMLQLALMCDVSEIFDYRNGIIKPRVLNSFFRQLEDLNIYSKQLIDFIFCLMHHQASSRPDFIETKAKILEIFSVNSLQDISRHSFDIKSSISSLRRSKTNQNGVNIQNSRYIPDQNPQNNNLLFSLQRQSPFLGNSYTKSCNRQPSEDVSTFQQKNYADGIILKNVKQIVEDKMPEECMLGIPRRQEVDKQPFITTIMGVQREVCYTECHESCSGSDEGDFKEFQSTKNRPVQIQKSQIEMKGGFEMIYSSEYWSESNSKKSQIEAIPTKIKVVDQIGWDSTKRNRSCNKNRQETPCQFVKSNECHKSTQVQGSNRKKQNHSPSLVHNQYDYSQLWRKKSQQSQPQNEVEFKKKSTTWDSNYGGISSQNITPQQSFIASNVPNQRNQPVGYGYSHTKFHPTEILGDKNYNISSFPLKQPEMTYKTNYGTNSVSAISNELNSLVKNEPSLYKTHQLNPTSTAKSEYTDLSFLEMMRSDMRSIMEKREKEQENCKPVYHRF